VLARGGQNYEPLEKGLKFRISTSSVGAPAGGTDLLLKSVQYLFLQDIAVRANLSGSTVTVIRQEIYGEGFHWEIGVIYTENISRQGRGVLWLGRPGFRGEPIHVVRGCLGVQSALAWLVVLGCAAGVGIFVVVWAAGVCAAG
jgi:hypothetical protein